MEGASIYPWSAVTTYQGEKSTSIIVHLFWVFYNLQLNLISTNIIAMENADLFVDYSNDNLFMFSNGFLYNLSMCLLH